jgi:hypothetical protein
MATLSRLAFAFGAPAIIMATAAGVVWLSTSQLDTVIGPSRPVLFTPPSELSPNVGVDGAGPPSPPPNVDVPELAWQAQARNALIPYSRASLLSPARFSTSADPEAPAQALQCLTSAIYYEAGREPEAGKRAVAQVVINRWANRAFPKTICGVVDQGAPAPGCQFSFMCDGSLTRKPAPDAWRDAEMIARAALNGYVETSVGAATHYHADYVVPVWAATMLKLTKLGRHIFYRWPGAAAYVIAHPIEPVASASLEASSASGGLVTAASQANGAAVLQSARASAPADTSGLDAAAAKAPAPPKSQAPAPTMAPPVQPVVAPKPKPEAPRRPVPPPSLRVGPV